MIKCSTLIHVKETVFQPIPQSFPFNKIPSPLTRAGTVPGLERSFTQSTLELSGSGSYSFKTPH